MQLRESSQWAWAMLHFVSVVHPAPNARLSRFTKRYRAGFPSRVRHHPSGTVPTTSGRKPLTSSPGDHHRGRMLDRGRGVRGSGRHVVQEHRLRGGRGRRRGCGPGCQGRREPGSGKKDMKITVLTAAFNPGPALRERLESVAEQKLPAGVEVDRFVLDGGSTDGTVGFLKAWAEAAGGRRYRSGPDGGFYPKNGNAGGIGSRGVAEPQRVVERTPITRKMCNLFFATFSPLRLCARFHFGI